MNMNDVINITPKVNLICAKRITVKLQENNDTTQLESKLIESVTFEGGCSGQGKAISRLLKGRTISEAISDLKGIQCRNRGTSCSDQLARGLNDWIDSVENAQ